MGKYIHTGFTLISKLTRKYLIEFMNEIIKAVVITFVITMVIAVSITKKIIIWQVKRKFAKLQKG